jgi:hypothetical protein
MFMKVNWKILKIQCMIFFSSKFDVAGIFGFCSSYFDIKHDFPKFGNFLEDTIIYKAIFSGVRFTDGIHCLGTFRKPWGFESGYIEL